jgi:hypothetical protein
MMKSEEKSIIFPVLFSRVNQKIRYDWDVNIIINNN